MNKKLCFDDAHKNSEGYTASKSLIDFLQKDQYDIFKEDDLSILEVGCGKGSLFEEIEGLRGSWNVLGIDISKIAIEAAKKRLAGHNNLFFQVSKIEDLEENNIFDVIIDSHVLHCLTDAKDRASYLGSMYKRLRPGGVIYIETMVAHKNLIFEFDQWMDFETCILYQNESPIRSIKEAFELEEEFISHGAKIFYLEVFESLQFIAHSQRSFVNQGDPEVLRALLFKEKA